MKDISFSDAIRLGAAQGPQLFNVFRDGQGGSCAVGAAAMGAGNVSLPSLLWPEIYETPEDYCPVCGSLTFTAGGQSGVRINSPVAIVTHLNNDHRWTREAIADWWDENYSEKVVAQVRESAEVLTT